MSKIYVKMVNITCHWGDATETTMTCNLPSIRMAVIKKTKCAGEKKTKGDLHILPVGM
jgi:hypothetical protein